MSAIIQSEMGLRYNSGKPVFHTLPREMLEFLARNSGHPRAMQDLVSWWFRESGFERISVLPEPSVCWPVHCPVRYLRTGRDLIPDEFWRLGPLFPHEAALVAVLGYGAEKYSPKNWEKGLLFSCCFDSAFRHALASAHRDEESGLPHACHLVFNIVAPFVFSERGRADLDDRPARVVA